MGATVPTIVNNFIGRILNQARPYHTLVTFYAGTNHTVKRRPHTSNGHIQVIPSIKAEGQLTERSSQIHLPRQIALDRLFCPSAYGMLVNGKLWANCTSIKFENLSYICTNS